MYCVVAYVNICSNGSHWHLGIVKHFETVYKSYVSTAFYNLLSVHILVIQRLKVVEFNARESVHGCHRVQHHCKVYICY